MSMNMAQEVAGRLQLIRNAAATDGVVAAATAAGRAGETAVKVVLRARSHKAGTPTPSPRGSPPAKVSGALARSVQRTPTALLAPGIAATAYGPIVIYGPVHEYGAEISVKNAKVLANKQTGQFFGTHVTIPKRPFMRPTTEALITSGTLARVMGEAFLAAINVV